MSTFGVSGTRKGTEVPPRAGRDPASGHVGAAPCGAGEGGIRQRGDDLLLLIVPREAAGQALLMLVAVRGFARYFSCRELTWSSGRITWSALPYGMVVVEFASLR